eukprot:2200990-Pleurochrysis_carterae.AAC.1
MLGLRFVARLAGKGLRSPLAVHVELLSTASTRELLLMVRVGVAECRNAIATSLLDAPSSGHGDGPASMAAAVAIARVASACVRAK